MADSKVKPLYFKSYLQVIKNSVGANTYKNFYARVDEEVKDVLEDGNLSCAYFVCSILYNFKLIQDMHTTVAGTVRDLEESGFEKIDSDSIGVDEPKEGAVIVWTEDPNDQGGIHKHLGFYIGDNQAISNSTSQKTPQIMDYKFRNIEAIYFKSFD